MDQTTQIYRFENPLYSSGVGDDATESMLRDICFSYWRRSALTESLICGMSEQYGIPERLASWALVRIDDTLRLMGLDSSVFNCEDDLYDVSAYVAGRYVQLEFSWK